MSTFERQLDANANYIGGLAMMLEGIALDYKHEKLHEVACIIRAHYGQMLEDSESEAFGNWSDMMQDEFREKLGLTKYQFEYMLVKKLIDLIEKFTSIQQKRYLFGYKIIPEQIVKVLKAHKKTVDPQKYKQFTHLLISHAGL